MKGDEVTWVLLSYVGIETLKQMFSQTTRIRTVSELFTVSEIWHLMKPRFRVSDGY